jgi:uncharacterized protein YcnI
MRRLALLVAVAFGALVALAAPAVAHVTVASSDATPGGDAVVTFTVPTESDTASTTKLVASIPPIASVAVRPVPGWTVTTKTSKLATPLKSDEGDVTSAVSEITWTATSAASAIKPGQFGEFDISVGPLPNAASVSFPAIQYYSDGTVVKWIEQAAPGSKTEPEHPAPTLKITAAAATTDARSATVKKETESAVAPTVLAIISLVIAAAALGYAYVNRARTRA